MMLKLEQIAALLVAAGLAIVSYLLFFSWSGGGGYQHRGLNQPKKQQAEQVTTQDLSGDSRKD